MSLNKKQLRKLENITAGFIISVLVLAGWLSINQKNFDQQSNNIPGIGQSSDDSAESMAKYRNPQVGLEFYYPKDWLVQEEYINKKDTTDGINITAKSPTGLQVNINGHYTGTQSGSCDKNIYDKPHITSSCSTLEVSGKELLAIKSPEGDVFLVAAKFTPPNSAKKSQYLLFLSSDPNVALSQNPLVGAWPNYGTLNTGQIYFDTSLSGVDNSYPGYYRTPDVITAGNILKSINLF